MRPFVLFLLGALVGAAAAGWVSASLIHWWAVPPFPSPGCDYSPAIEYAVKHMLIWECIGAAGGAVLVTVLYFVLKSGKKKPPAPPLAAPPAAG